MVIDPWKVLNIIRNVAAEEILPRFRHLAPDDISEKNPGDIVTIADIEAERRLSDELTPLLAGSLVVGEEGVAREPGRIRSIDSEHPVWIVDPVDGTQNFADGKPCFAVMVALCRTGVPEAAWIYDPINDTAIHTIRGQGVWEGQQRIYLPSPVPLSDMQGSLNRRRTNELNRRREAGETGIPHLVKRYRCVGREYMDLARGKLNFLRYGGQLKPWDHAPGVLIHRELGGYDAIAETGKPYQPSDGISNDTIMLTRNHETWDKLTQFLRE